jgi:hypothetical protein
MPVITTALIPAIALALTIAPPSASAAGAPTAALPCHASMTNAHPADFTSTGVKVRTVAYAHIKTVAHYRTTNHPKYRRANAEGHRTVWYYVSGATPGYRVVVDVYVSRHHRTGSCQTAFTPHA